MNKGLCPIMNTPLPNFSEVRSLSDEVFWFLVRDSKIVTFRKTSNYDQEINNLPILRPGKIHVPDKAALLVYRDL